MSKICQGKRGNGRCYFNICGLENTNDKRWSSWRKVALVCIATKRRAVRILHARVDAHAVYSRWIRAPPSFLTSRLLEVMMLKCDNGLTSCRVSGLKNSGMKPRTAPTAYPPPTAHPMCPSANSNLPLPVFPPSGIIYLQKKELNAHKLSTSLRSKCSWTESISLINFSSLYAILKLQH